MASSRSTRASQKAPNQTIISRGQNFALGPTVSVVATDGTLYVTDQTCSVVNTSPNAKGAVIRVDPTQSKDNNQTIVSQGQGFLLLFDIALDTDGTLRVIDASCCTGAHGALIQVDQTLANGSNQFLISDDQNFIIPIGLATVPQVPSPTPRP